MKALTIYEPYASLIARGGKRIETRKWATSYRGPIAIHAAKHMRWDEIQRMNFERGFRTGCEAYGIPIPVFLQCRRADVMAETCGRVIAVATLTDVIEVTHETSWKIPDELGAGPHERVFGNYYNGSYAWLLSDVRPLETPIPAKGRQRLWEWDPPALDDAA